MKNDNHEEIPTGKRENNLMYLRYRSKEVGHGPIDFDGWHCYRRGGKWASNRKKQRFTRETIRTSKQ